jgi:hypothetical protein
VGVGVIVGEGGVRQIPIYFWIYADF